MTTRDIVLGDDIGIDDTLTVDGTAADISAATSVKAALVALDGTVGLSATLTSIDSYTDKAGTVHTASWATGLVVITFTSAQTRTLTVNTRYRLEVTVDDGGITTWPVHKHQHDFITRQDYIDTT